MVQPQIKLPDIDMELVRIRASLPVKLAELSHTNREAAILILQDWGAGAKPLRVLYEITLSELKKFTA